MPEPITSNRFGIAAGKGPTLPADAIEFVRQFSWDIIPQEVDVSPHFCLTV